MLPSPIVAAAGSGAAIIAAMFVLRLYKRLYPHTSISQRGEKIVQAMADRGEKENHSVYIMPEESERHEGTWLQWPHHYQYGMTYRNRLDSTWISITKALSPNERVHIIAYNAAEKERICKLLAHERISMDNIDFMISKTDDVWVRDNGPIFARDARGRLVTQHWGFNGWGNKVDAASKKPIMFANCNKIPSRIAASISLPLVDVSATMVNEGGSVDIDGHGTLMACKSSVLNRNRNPGMKQQDAESIFRKYLGVSNFIWLEGNEGKDITDQHIDGFARFVDFTTIITMEPKDLKYFDVKKRDIETLYASKNKHGEAYRFVTIPLTSRNVTTAYGRNLFYKGSYLNYYVANNTVLAPIYKDPHDSTALKILQDVYPTRSITGIDVRNLYEYGGMVHCVTQQQPADK